MQQTPTLAAPIPGGGAAPSPGPIAALVRWLERRRRATRARSYHAELDGLVEATRLRVIAQRLAGL